MKPTNALKLGCICLTRTYWRIVQFQCNHSKFNGGRYAASDYSEIVCLECRRHWRTKAKYVDTLSMISDAERAKLLGITE